MQSVQYLLSNANLDKLQVLLYPKTIHGKVLLVDRKIAFLGSANLMKSSIDKMGELNVRIEGKNRKALLKLRLTLRKDILKSKPLLHPPRLWWIGRGLAFFGL